MSIEQLADIADKIVEVVTPISSTIGTVSTQTTGTCAPARKHPTPVATGRAVDASVECSYLSSEGEAKPKPDPRKHTTALVIAWLQLKKRMLVSLPF